MPRILVSGGDPDLRDIARRILEQHDYMVHVVADQAAMLASLEHEEFDALVLQIMDPWADQNDDVLLATMTDRTLPVIAYGNDPRYSEPPGVELYLQNPPFT